MIAKGLFRASKAPRLGFFIILLVLFLFLFYLLGGGITVTGTGQPPVPTPWGGPCRDYSNMMSSGLARNDIKNGVTHLSAKYTGTGSTPTGTYYLEIAEDSVSLAVPEGQKWSLVQISDDVWAAATSEGAPFWKLLREDAVAALNAGGSAVVQTGLLYSDLMAMLSWPCP